MFTVQACAYGYLVMNVIGRPVAGPFNSKCVANHAALWRNRDAQG